MIAGVPLIGFALAADQFENMLKVPERGFGIIFSRDDFTTEALLAAVADIWSNSSFARCVLTRPG